VKHLAAFRAVISALSTLLAQVNCKWKVLLVESGSYRSYRAHTHAMHIRFCSMFTVVDSLLQRKVITLALYVLSEMDPPRCRYISQRTVSVSANGTSAAACLGCQHEWSGDRAVISRLRCRYRIGIYCRRKRILDPLPPAVDEFCERGKNEAQQLMEWFGRREGLRDGQQSSISGQIKHETARSFRLVEYSFRRTSAGHESSPACAVTLLVTPE